ncbi:MAG TPA: hemolysin family protein [Acidimicrobiia bacterium]|nr:hemolysin family protein [Acidimicrobiia bacterium]
MTFGAFAAIVLLLLANGFFVAAEFAFTAASRPRLAAQPSRSARAALAAIDELSFTLAGAQLGITIASLLLGFVAEPAVAALLEAAVGAFVDLPDQVLHTMSFVVALSIVVYFHMVIGEMAPKNIAISDPERASLIMALPFRLYATLLRPVIWLLNGLANLGLRLVGVDPEEVGEAHTVEDLSSLITAGRREGVVEEFAHRLLTGAIDLGALEATQVMVPRPDVVALPASVSLGELERTFVEGGHSRIPIYGEDLDDLVGFVHIKDLLGRESADHDSPLDSSMVRPLLVVPESARVDRLLEDMRRGRNHLAAVVDEHGGTAGIVTLEDIVEEIVGEIRDEHDVESDGVRRLSANRWLVDAIRRPSEVTRACGVDLPEGEYDTMSGLVMDHLGRIPVAGDRIDADDWAIRVRSMDGRRVGQVELVVKERKGDE